MYQAGVPPLHAYLRTVRSEQRQGLWLYHVIEPEALGGHVRQSQRRTQRRNIRRTRQPFYGHRKILNPITLTGKSTRCSCYTVCLKSLPNITVIKSPFICSGIRKRHEHYSTDAAWRYRIARYSVVATDLQVLLNNDYWCRALSFSPTKPKNYQRYNERMKAKRREWGSYATPTHSRNNSLSL